MIGRRRLHETIARPLQAAGALGMLLVGFAPSPVAAMTRTEKTFGSWDVVCVQNDDNSKRCSMIQSRVTADKKQVALIWSISSDTKKALSQTVTVPAGVSIKEGVRLFLGDADPIPIAYDICGPRACVATMPIDQKLVAAVRADKKALASYVQASRQLVQINLDLTGFGDAYDYLAQQLS